MDKWLWWVGGLAVVIIVARLVWLLVKAEDKPAEAGDSLVGG